MYFYATKHYFSTAMEDHSPAPPPEKPKKEKSKLKNIAFWAGLFRNFFTIIASLVSVLTLFILIRQNENTYRPDLEMAIETPVFEVLYSDTILSCNDIRMKHAGDSTLAALSVRLVNLGMGAAKDIDLRWLTNPEKMRGTVHLGADSVETGIRYEPSLDMVVFGACINQPYQTEHLSYVLPVNQAVHSDEIHLPAYILTSWNNLLIRSLLPDDEAGRCTERLRVFCRDFGHFGLEVAYSDINRKRHHRTFQLHLLPRYIDVEGRKIVCAFGLSNNEMQAPEKMPGISVLFPGHVLKKIDLRQ